MECHKAISLSGRVIFVSPAKTSPVTFGNLPVQTIRTNVSIAGLTIVGALEANGFEVDFIDVTAEAPNQHRFIGKELVAAGIPDKDVVDRIAAAHPRYVLITSMFTFEQMVVDHLIAALRQRLVDITIILGGAHATLRPEWHLDIPEYAPDYIVLGEGEETIVELIKELDSRDPRPETVAGLAYRSARGEIQRTASRPTPTKIKGAWALDTVLRHPNGENRYWERWSRKSPLYYAEDIGSDVPTFILFASRGCPFGCGYCTSTGRFGQRIRHIGADLMFERFLTLRQEFGVAVFCNQADTFCFHPDDRRFLDLVAEHRRQGDTGFVINNPNAFFLRSFFRNDGRIDEGLIELLRASGFNTVTIAIETLEQRFNEKIDWSRISPDLVYEVCRCIRSAGMRTELYMMYGFPGQTADEFGRDLAFAEAALSSADSISWHRASILPGTRYYQELIVEKGREAEYRAAVRNGCSCFDRGSFAAAAHPAMKVDIAVMEDAVRPFGQAWI